MRNFATGLKKDLDAVHAGLTEGWSNGLVEGFVNKLKLVKRQGYGRAGFGLLRARCWPPEGSPERRSVKDAPFHQDADRARTSRL